MRLGNAGSHRVWALQESQGSQSLRLGTPKKSHDKFLGLGLGSSGGLLVSGLGHSRQSLEVVSAGEERAGVKPDFKV